MSALPRAMPSAARALRTNESGLYVGLMIAWLVLEYTRPPNPMKIPFMISLVFLASWLAYGRKRWNVQIVLMLLFVGQMTAMSPFAENNFTAVMTTREVFTVVVCIAVPMAHFIDSLKKLDLILRVWIGLFVYMAIVALMNGGNGPGGAKHGVDENYTALFMTMAVALAYFSAFTTRSVLKKIGLYAFCALFVAAIVVGNSRGGFVGLVGVALICWWYTPRRILGVVGALAALALFLVFVPESYMAEIRTIGDTSEGTADARIRLWTIAVQMFMDHPILGVGPGNYRWVAEFYKPGADPGLQPGMHVTHSLYFELLSEMGTTGVLMWFTVAYANFRDCRRVERMSRAARRGFARATRGRATTPQRQSVERLARAEMWSRAIQAALVGFMLCSLFLSTLYYTTFWLLTALAVALLEATRREVALLQRSIVTSPEAASAPADEPDRAVADPRTAALSGLLGRSMRRANGE